MYRSGILENMIVAVVVLGLTPFQEAVPGVKMVKFQNGVGEGEMCANDSSIVWAE